MKKPISRDGSISHCIIGDVPIFFSGIIDFDIKHHRAFLNPLALFGCIAVSEHAPTYDAIPYIGIVKF
jgi:hypothetical protein